EFKLRQGVTFHNGEPFNAESVKVTLDRWMDPAVGATIGPILYPKGSIAEVTAVDDATVRIRTEKPFGAMLASLQLTYMMPAQATKAAGTKPIPQLIGTGPYRVLEWVMNDHATMAPFDGYWGDKAQIGTLIYRQVTEDATRFAAFRAGEIDILSDIDADEEKQLAADERFTIMKQLTAESLYPVFNVTRPPFDNAKVRQAMLYGIDRASIIQALLGDGAVPQGAPVSPEVFGFNDALTPYTFDIGKAKSLLQEAGYGNGFEATFMIPGQRYPKGADLAQTIAASATALGIKLNVEIPEESVGWNNL